MKINQEEFEILRKVSKNPKASQRELSSYLDISLGKINFGVDLGCQIGVQAQVQKKMHLKYTFGSSDR